MIFQVETHECGLACLAMVSEAHGRPVSLAALRRQAPPGRQGLDLRHLMRVGESLNLTSRALRLEPEDLPQIRMPCILHWDLRHYVVAERRTWGGLMVLDPALGRQRLSWAEVGKRFSGVALEITPAPGFRREQAPPTLTWRSLLAAAPGWQQAVWPLLIIALVLEALGILAPLYSQILVDDVVGAGDIGLLPLLVMGFGLLLALQVVLAWWRSWMLIRLSQALSWRWMTQAFRQLMGLPLSYFERRPLGDIQSRLGAVDELQRGLTQAALESVLDGLMAVVALAMMLAYSPTLTAIVVTAVAAYALLRAAVQPVFRQAQAEREALSAQEQSHLLETLRTIGPLKQAGRELERQAQWQKRRGELMAREVRTAGLATHFQAARSLLLGLENLVVLALGATFVTPMSLTGTVAPAAWSDLVSGWGQWAGSNPMTLGMLFAFLAFKSQFSHRVAALIDRVAEWRALSVPRERLADIVLEPPETADPRPDADLSPLPARLELRDVGFRHGPQEPWLLRGVNLIIEPGEQVAITGPSGCGKTTLLRLALGLLRPTEGQVLYGGHPIEQLGLQNLRGITAAVLQDDLLLAGTVLDNIAFLDESPDAARAVACAQAAQLHTDIVGWPMGYDSHVGELGIGLSGGQRQRLLIARALYRQPRLLVLDEATSHLDTSCELAFNSVLQGLSMTRLVVAHRAETLAAARRVLWLGPTAGGWSSLALQPPQ